MPYGSDRLFLLNGKIETFFAGEKKHLPRKLILEMVMMSCIIAAYKNNHVCIVRKLTVSRWTRTKINSGVLAPRTIIIPCRYTCVNRLFGTFFCMLPSGSDDTRINYSCSKASTEGCMEVALRDHYIIPITSSQWVKMFWHKVGTNSNYIALAPFQNEGYCVIHLRYRTHPNLCSKAPSWYDRHNLFLHAIEPFSLHRQQVYH